MYVLLLALMVPAASGLVDCRLACRSCRENKEVPAMVEVYCSMCEECKERRREKYAATLTTIHHDETMNVRLDRVRYEEYPPLTTEPYLFGPTNDNIIEKIRKEFATAERYPFGHFDDDHLEEDRRRRRPNARQWAREGVEYESNSVAYNRLRPEDIPEGCPTPPVCSEEETEPAREVLTAKPITTTTPTKTTTTTTTTTTTKKPCPRFKPCRKKRKRRNCCRPCMPICAFPMCPGQQIQQCGQMCPGQPCDGQTTTVQVFPPRNSAEPLALTTKSSNTNSTPSNDYIYMYVGVPKNVIKQ